MKKPTRSISQTLSLFSVLGLAFLSPSAVLAEGPKDLSYADLTSLGLRPTIAVSRNNATLTLTLAQGCEVELEINPIATPEDGNIGWSVTEPDSGLSACLARNKCASVECMKTLTSEVSFPEAGSGKLAIRKVSAWDGPTPEVQWKSAAVLTAEKEAASAEEKKKRVDALAEQLDGEHCETCSAVAKVENQWGALTQLRDLVPDNVAQLEKAEKLLVTDAIRAFRKEIAESEGDLALLREILGKLGEARSSGILALAKPKDVAGLYVSIAAAAMSGDFSELSELGADDDDFYFSDRSWSRSAWRSALRDSVPESLKDAKELAREAIAAASEVDGINRREKRKLEENLFAIEMQYAEILAEPGPYQNFGLVGYYQSSEFRRFARKSENHWNRRCAMNPGAGLCSQLRLHFQKQRAQMLVLANGGFYRQPDANSSLLGSTQNSGLSNLNSAWASSVLGGSTAITGSGGLLSPSWSSTGTSAASTTPSLPGATPTVFYSAGAFGTPSGFTSFGG